ncbi:hypothetical protein BJ165DRAFT_1459118 [Panaeolus papilionaceus]|nr:hypothetical protein BJ165DRAFT_1459118 [Panaeolus papilionaceus]
MNFRAVVGAVGLGVTAEHGRKTRSIVHDKFSSRTKGQTVTTNHANEDETETRNNAVNRRCTHSNYLQVHLALALHHDPLTLSSRRSR